MYTEKLGRFSLLATRAAPAGCSVRLIRAVHVYSSYICIPRFRSQRYISAAILAALASTGSIPIRVAFSLRRARSSFYHRFRFRFPAYSPLTTSRWQICRNRKTDGELMAGYRTSLIVHSVYDNLDRKFAWKNVCCNLKSLYHVSSRVYVTCN